MGILLSLPFGACSDNPAGSNGKPKCDHIDADGMVIEQDATAILHQWQGVTVGELAVSAGEVRGRLAASFFDADSQRIVVKPECVDHELRWDIADTTRASISRLTGQRYAFSLTGKQPGATTVRFRIWHGDHPDFTSLVFPIRVTGGPVHEPVSPQAVVVIHQCSWSASFNYPPTRNVQKATGPIVLTTGQLSAPMEGRFFSGQDSLLAIVDPAYHLIVVATDSNLVAGRRSAGDPVRTFRLQAKTPGTTTIRLRLMYGATQEYESGEIPVSIEGPFPEPATALPSFWLKKNGVRCIIVRDGRVVPNCGSSTANPGYFTAQVGELTDLYTWQLLDDTCRGSTPGSGLYSLVFDFADPCIAGIVRHPEHWDEIMLFHIYGISAGETTVRIRLMKGMHLEAITPPLRVVITPAGPSS